MSETSREKLLELENLTVTLRRQGRSVPLVRDATFEVRRGEIVCLVGESGSGKSVTARAIMGLMQMEPDMEVGGSVRFAGRELAAHGPDQFAALRGRDFAMVFQEPLSSLDPVFTVESQLAEALRRQGRSSRQAEGAKMRDLLKEVGIQDADRVLRSHPHQLSGGMCQRVMIAMALAARPRLLIADEPTTALDVTIQAQILELIESLREESGMSVLLVTHDMGVAADLADRVVVMYAGRVVEDADPSTLFMRAQHPYSAGLLACIPPLTGARPAVLPAIPGSVPDPSRLPGGCAFNPRCPRATEVCRTEDPPLIPSADSKAACWHPTDAHDVLVATTGPA